MSLDNYRAPYVESAHSSSREGTPPGVKRAENQAGVHECETCHYAHLRGDGSKPKGVAQSESLPAARSRVGSDSSSGSKSSSSGSLKSAFKSGAKKAGTVRFDDSVDVRAAEPAVVVKTEESAVYEALRKETPLTEHNNKGKEPSIKPSPSVFRPEDDPFYIGPAPVPVSAPDPSHLHPGFPPTDTGTGGAFSPAFEPTLADDWENLGGTRGTFSSQPQRTSTFTPPSNPFSTGSNNPYSHGSSNTRSHSFPASRFGSFFDHSRPSFGSPADKRPGCHQDS